MTAAFLDLIQVEEFDYDEMFDLYEDNFETISETDVDDWSFVEYETI